MKKSLIVANWKMNPQELKEAKNIALASDFKNVVICSPFVFLREIKKTIKNAKIGGQNCFYEKLVGPFTGEVSAKMLKDVGCDYVILGHSERREIFKENHEEIKKKIKTALAVKITPIVCIGEDEGTKNGGETIKKQIFGSIDKSFLSKIIIAYEPVFAIGTGKPCLPDLAEKRRVFIKSTLSKIGKKGESLPILYGGSVNSKNAIKYTQEAGFDGILVGGASLKKEEFKKILSKA